MSKFEGKVRGKMQVHEMYPEIDGPRLNNIEGGVSSQLPC